METTVYERVRRCFFERAPRGLVLFDLKDAKVIQDGALSIKCNRILFSKAALTFVQLILSAAFFRAYNVWIAFVGFITFVVNLYCIWVHFYVCGQYELYYIWVHYYICGQFLLHLYLQHSPPPPFPPPQNAALVFWKKCRNTSRKPSIEILKRENQALSWKSNLLKSSFSRAQNSTI